MTQPTNLEQLKEAAREKYWNDKPKKKVTGKGIVTGVSVEDLDEIVTSTYLQAVEDAITTVDNVEQNDESGDLSPMLVLETLQSLKQTKDRQCIAGVDIQVAVGYAKIGDKIYKEVDGNWEQLTTLNQQ